MQDTEGKEKFRSIPLCPSSSALNFILLNSKFHRLAPAYPPVNVVKQNSVAECFPGGTSISIVCEGFGNLQTQRVVCKLENEQSTQVV